MTVEAPPYDHLDITQFAANHPGERWILQYGRELAMNPVKRYIVGRERYLRDFMAEMTAKHGPDIWEGWTIISLDTGF